MPKVLVLEDDPWRQNWFGAKFKDVVPCLMVGEALEALATQEFDLIFLDHDLRTEPAVGRDVAQWLCENPEAQRTAAIIVHSVNLVSAHKMYMELHLAGRMVSVMPIHVLMDVCGG